MHRKYKNILQKLNVYDGGNIIKYLYEDQDTLHFFSLFNTNKAYQIGGGKEAITFDGIKVILNNYKEDDRIIYSINRKNDTNKEACLLIMVSNNLPIAYINNVSFYPDCFSDSATKGSGTWLLKVAIEYLKTNKRKMKINKIQLKDNALKYCKEAKTSIRLSLLSTLTSGDTWYGNHGFIPYDPENDVQDKKLTKLQINNRKIMSSTKVSQTNVEKYIRKYAKKHEISIDGIDDLFNHYNSMPLSIFLKQFLKNFDRTCIIFNEFYIKLSKEIGLYDFFASSFYLPL